MTNKEKIAYIKTLRQKEKENIVRTKEEIIRINKNKNNWMSLWRQNPNLYIEYVLGIPMFPYQHYGIFQMNDCTDMVDVSTRGTSKSWKAIVMSVARCMLFSGTKVGVGAVTKSQADEDFTTTFKQEIVMKQSKYLRYLWDNGLITSKETEKGYLVSFWNGSSIQFFPCIDSSRGKVLLVNNIIAF